MNDALHDTINDAVDGTIAYEMNDGIEGTIRQCNRLYVRSVRVRISSSGARARDTGQSGNLEAERGVRARCTGQSGILEAERWRGRCGLWPIRDFRGRACVCVRVWPRIGMHHIYKYKPLSLARSAPVNFSSFLLLPFHFQSLDFILRYVGTIKYSRTWTGPPKKNTGRSGSKSTKTEG